MRTLFWAIGLIILPAISRSQSINSKVAAAVSTLLADTQMKHAILGLYIVNSKTGEVVFDKNGSVGFAAASSQKVITAAAAYTLLGKDYRFKTEVGYSGSISNGNLQGNLVITGFGDPTLGSPRYAATSPTNVLAGWSSRLKAAGINNISGKMLADESAFALQPLAGGWIWDDIGNYYGAGHYALNWRENQYDLVLRAGNNEGDTTTIIATEPTLIGANLVNELRTGKQGSGDNAYIYLPPYSKTGFVIGTIPAGAKRFTISGSLPWPARQLQAEASATFSLGQQPVMNDDDVKYSTLLANRKPVKSTLLFTHYSPPLDSIVYWFLKKSVNLYGEALVRTIGYEQTGYGSTDVGLSAVFKLFQQQGVDSLSIAMADGSGLSPQNRITPKAFVQVMQHARKQSWFGGFYNALPEYNGLKMKSGTIGGAKSFTGYATSSAGTMYSFAIVINNYNGSAAALVRKMYKVLDVLK